MPISFVLLRQPSCPAVLEYLHTLRSSALGFLVLLASCHSVRMPISFVFLGFYPFCRIAFRRFFVRPVSSGLIILPRCFLFVNHFFSDSFYHQVRSFEAFHRFLLPLYKVASEVTPFRVVYRHLCLPASLSASASATALLLYHRMHCCFKQFNPAILRFNHIYSTDSRFYSHIIWHIPISCRMMSLFKNRRPLTVLYY